VDIRKCASCGKTVPHRFNCCEPLEKDSYGLMVTFTVYMFVVFVVALFIASEYK
jgi:hypothetical protein